jgi:hypothetical protein
LMWPREPWVSLGTDHWLIIEHTDHIDWSDWSHWLIRLIKLIDNW